MKSVWKYISGLGTAPNFSTTENSRIIVINKISAVIAFFCLLSITPNLYLGIFSAVYVLIGIIICNSLVLFLNHLKFYLLAKLIAILIPISLVVLFSIIFGRNFNGEYVIITLPLAYLLFFGKTNINGLHLLVFFGIIFFVFFTYYNFRPILELEDYLIHRLIFILVLSMASFFAIRFYEEQNLVIKEELELSNEQLKEKIETQKAMEETLMASEARYRLLFENGFDGVLTFNINDMTVVGGNKKIFEYFEIEKEDFIGKSFEELLPHNQDGEATTKELIYQLRKEILEKGKVKYQLTQKRKNGEKFYSDIFSFLLPAPQEHLVICIYKDITDEKIAIETQREYAAMLEEQKSKFEVQNKRLKNAVDNLFNKQKELKVIMDSSPACIAFIDKDLKFKIVNKTYEEWYGIEPSDIIGKNLDLLLGSEGMQKIKPYISDVLMGNAVFFEHYIELPNQKSGKYVKVKFSPDKDFNTNEITGFFSFIEDVTSEKEAEIVLEEANNKLKNQILQEEITNNALREGEERFRAVFKGSPLGVAIDELESKKVIMANHRFAELVGAEDTTEILGKKGDDFTFEEHPDFLQNWEKLLTKELDSIYVEKLYKRLDGSTFWGGTNRTIINIDGKPCMIGFVHDITKQKEQENTITLSNSLLQSTIESTADGILVVSDKGVVQLTNHQFFHIWGIPKEETVDQNLGYDFALNLIKDKDEFLKTVLYFNDDKIEEVGNGIIELKNGKILNYFTRPKKVMGKIDGRVWSFRDITNLKQTEAKLIASNKELNQFASVASHDMKEPLRMISSFSQLLSQSLDGQLNDRSKEFLFYIEDAAKRMNVLVEDLLTYARAGNETKESKIIRIEDVVFSVQNNLRLKLSETEGVINYDELPEIMGHFNPFVQLFQNIIANSLKFRKPDVAPIIDISFKKEKNKFYFEIQDNGIGIKQENIHEIFDVFRRLHSKKEFEGSGIGLATCKKLVERYGGKIEVSSKLGEGTCFTISFPIKILKKPALA